jgi:hypothetical protein
MSPRYRWVKLYTIAYVISVIVVVTIMVVMRYNDPPKYRPPIGVLHILGGVFLFVGLYFVCFIIVGTGFAGRQFAVQSELDAESDERAFADAKRNHRDYLGVSVVPDYSPPTDGPGRYRINGVNRATKQDATVEVDADSAANAKVKAELDGIIVTSVTKSADGFKGALEDIDVDLPAMSQDSDAFPPPQ